MCRQDQRGAVASWGLLESDYYQPQTSCTVFRAFFPSLAKKEQMKTVNQRWGHKSVNKKLAKKSKSKQIRTSNEAEVVETGLVISNMNKEGREREASRSLVCSSYPQELQTDPGTLLVGSLRKHFGRGGNHLNNCSYSNSSQIAVVANFKAFVSSALKLLQKSILSRIKQDLMELRRKRKRSPNVSRHGRHKKGIAVMYI